MKLLVLAQTPPPLHGQSLMVQTLVSGLPARGVDIHHVNLGLSREAADIGRWRAGKIAAVLDACLHAIIARFVHGCDTLYYVPAPAKRGALYRDWLVMLLCRPFFKRLILHWHAAGLGAWLQNHATPPERWLTQRLLGEADLSIVLSNSLRADAVALRTKKIVVVANGIAAPDSTVARPPRGDVFQVLFLGLCSEEKGLFVTADAVLAANVRHAGRFRLVVAGEFPDQATRDRFLALSAAHPATIRHVGTVQGEEKSRLFQSSDCLCLPTRYPAEGQPLVLLEAMAHDLPIIATRWGAIADTLPPEAILIEIGQTDSLADALEKLSTQPPASGIFRRHYLAAYTRETHLAVLSRALHQL